jgi:hypothetical protein
MSINHVERIYMKVAAEKLTGLLFMYESNYHNGQSETFDLGFLDFKIDGAEDKVAHDAVVDFVTQCDSEFENRLLGVAYFAVENERPSFYFAALNVSPKKFVSTIERAYRGYSSAFVQNFSKAKAEEEKRTVVETHVATPVATPVVASVATVVTPVTAVAMDQPIRFCTMYEALNIDVDYIYIASENTTFARLKHVDSRNFENVFEYLSKSGLDINRFKYVNIGSDLCFVAV